MRNRFIAVAVAVLAIAAVSAGCSPHNDKVPQRTARITLDDNSLTSHAVSCSQVQWMLTVDIDAAPARVQMMLNLKSDKPVPESVAIDNLNNFTGVANTQVGSAQAVFTKNSYTVTGAAQGTNPDDVNNPKTATFRITVNC